MGGPAETAPPLRPDLQAVADLVVPKERVLDLGCGDGALLRYLIDQKSVTGRGVELSEAGVLDCMTKGLSVRQGDLNEGLDDYPAGSFDTVILSYTIPYLNNPAHVITEMLRVGARAIVSFPNWGHWRCRAALLWSGRSPSVPGLPQAWDTAPRARSLTLLDFQDFCNANRFKIAGQVYLTSRRPLTGAWPPSLFAATAIFDLRCK